MPARHVDEDGDGLIAPDERIAYVDPDDLSAYERIDPAEFLNFDEVDSTTIVDDGAPRESMVERWAAAIDRSL